MLTIWLLVAGLSGPAFAEDPEVVIPLDPGIEITDIDSAESSAASEPSVAHESVSAAETVPEALPEKTAPEPKPAIEVVPAESTPVEEPSTEAASEEVSPEQTGAEAASESADAPAAGQEPAAGEEAATQEPSEEVSPLGEAAGTGVPADEDPQKAEEPGLPVTLEVIPPAPSPEKEEEVIVLNPRFEDSGNGIIIDTDTALMWTKNANIFDISMPWQVAKEYIKEMNAGKRENFGYTDWRLPTVNEITSLVEKGREYPALPIGHPFKNVKNNFYWTSSGGFNVVGYAWVTDMGSGLIRYDLISFCNFSYAWPVRTTGLTAKRQMETDIDRSTIVPSQLGISPEDFMCAEGVGKKPPQPPIGIAATAVSPSEIVLSWHAPEGAEDIAWYNVYRGNENIQSAPSLHFVVEDINPDSIQCYTVTSYDTRNMESDRSAEACARTWAVPKNGTVWTSGANTYGQVGDGTFDDRQGLAIVEDIENVVKIASGVEHVLVLKEDGTVWAWGRNQRGQIGDGSLENRNRPVKVEKLAEVVDIAAGWYHSLALKKDGTVWAWGRNYYGQLGSGSTIDSPVPVQVENLVNIRKIAAGWYHSLAIKEDGTLWAWGWNHKGQLGTGTYNTEKRPVRILLPGEVVDIAGGMYHSLALDKEGTVWSWGYNEFGQLGNGTTANIPLPAPVKGVSNVSSISAGMHYSLVSKLDGSVWAWGRNDYTQLGVPDISYSPDPVEARGVEEVVKVAAGAHHALALHRDSTVSIWGWNYELLDKQSKVRPLSGIRGIMAIDAGIHFNLVLKQ